MTNEDPSLPFEALSLPVSHVIVRFGQSPRLEHDVVLGKRVRPHVVGMTTTPTGDLKTIFFVRDGREDEDKKLLAGETPANHLVYDQAYGRHMVDLRPLEEAQTAVGSHLTSTNPPIIRISGDAVASERMAIKYAGIAYLIEKEAQTQSLETVREIAMHPFLSVGLPVNLALIAGDEEVNHAFDQAQARNTAALRKFGVDSAAEKLLKAEIQKTEILRRYALYLMLLYRALPSPDIALGIAGKKAMDLLASVEEVRRELTQAKKHP